VPPERSVPLGVHGSAPLGTTRKFVAVSGSIRAMSTEVRVKSITSKLARMLAGFVDMVFTATPFCRIQRSTTWAAVLS
jgi:hypothetical protein